MTNRIARYGSARAPFGVIVIVVALLGGCSSDSVFGGDGDPTPVQSEPASNTLAPAPASNTSTPGPSSSGATGSEEPKPSATELDDEIADAVIAETLDAAGEALSAPSDPTDLTNVAIGSYLESVLALKDQYNAEGVRQVGTPTIEDAKIIEKHEDGSIAVEVCVDSSRVKILDEKDNDLRTDGTFDRSHIVFTLTPSGNGWLIADETFAEEPEC